MMTQVDKSNKQLRQSPTGDDFMKEKKISDILYHFYQINSIYEDGIRYCLRKDCTYSKMVSHFKLLDERAPFSESTFKNINKLLIGAGLITRSTLNRKNIYILNELQSGNYVFVKAETLRYLVDTATPNVIKIYTYLKKMYNIYQKNSNYKNYTTKKELLEAIGYSTKQDNYGMINNILKCLEFAGLIEYHIEYYNNSTEHVIPNIVIEKVNEDVRESSVIKKKKQKDTINYGEIPVPVPAPINKDAAQIITEPFHF